MLLWQLYETMNIEQLHELHTIVSICSFSGDSLGYHNNMPFSTFDRDNSVSGNCATELNGGWWYNDCLKGNLNGVYGVGTGDWMTVWFEWKGWESLKKIELKIRSYEFARGACHLLSLLLS